MINYNKNTICLITLSLLLLVVDGNARETKESLNVDCTLCSSQKKSIYTSKDFDSNQFNKCLDSLEQLCLIHGEGFRNYIENSMKIINYSEMHSLARSLKSNKNDTLMAKKDLLGFLNSIYSDVTIANPNIQSCLNHANKVLNKISNSSLNEDYYFEIINKFHKVDPGASWVSPIPMGNHYVVQATHKKTAQAFILDAYTFVSVTLVDKELKSDYYLFDQYEDCIAAQVGRINLGQAPNSDSLWDLLLYGSASLTPGVRSLIVSNTKVEALNCLNQ